MLLLYKPFIKRCNDRNMEKPKICVIEYYVFFIFALVGIFMLVANTANSYSKDTQEAYEIISLIILGAAFIIALMFFVQLYCMRGTKGDNKYGKDPLQ